MKEKIPKTIGNLLPGMRFKILGSKYSDSYTLLVKYDQKRMAVENERTKKRFEFPGCLPVFNVQDLRNR